MAMNSGSTKGLAPTFSAATPLAVRNAAGSVPATAMIAKIQEKGSRIKERARQHHKNFEDRWVANETLRLWQRHLTDAAKQSIPRGVTSNVTAASFTRTASHNIQARTARRLAKINAITTRLSNAVVRNLAPPDLKRTFSEAAPIPRLIASQKMKR
ncbi:MAG: hypothetical protein B7Y08_06525 [Rhodospirillales bacterium 24-66-33]|jgi:uncharacterized protein (DUF2062 family)|uniref:hypothetical protein n=1 Tax=Reyranella sp. TaxID=1929291 RepID=UPI000BC8BE92|nr:hypothetical protein [Reyranella sp.]OYY41105.1 MAG: hypothetical protein B7Y57_16265 [Rhodospirillales bacterium 35-66-84]OYZ96075.1 MAG: hypothetical protein B7Y08_06525 [Rhodospirillales bacterium 24-66-33]OZB21212.1 MAG: hypothetical protein B7X63_28000 [Rhodospirillales bacterium 39-66-50]HQS14893.1 hypothetical protein [Reyranella sp.]HQT14280.1 hypothetical protein [Reyranella sp.]